MRKLFFAAVVGISFWGFALPPYPPPDIVAKVIRVIDGNTIEVKLLQVPDKYAPHLQPEQVVQVRYISVNAPELDQPDGQKAAELNRLLVENKEVYLELEKIYQDLELRIVSGLWDLHGRLRAYVYLDPHGYLMVNRLLISTPIIGVNLKDGHRYISTLRLTDIDLYIDILDISDPVKPGGFGWLVIKTAPGAVCSATLRFPAKELWEALAMQLKLQQKAGEDGVVEWFFTVPGSVVPGLIHVWITAAFGSVEEALYTSIEVVRE